MALTGAKQEFLETIESEWGVSEGADRPDLAAELEAGLIDWAKPLLQPYRYKCLWGGRGSAKSYSIADVLLIEGLRRRIRVLCAREFQNSIKESVHALLKERIDVLNLDNFYRVQESAIVGSNASQFIFKGIRHNVQSIKSMTGLSHCWIEEGQTISAESWQVLIPTIREEGSEVWVSFNPDQKTDIVYQELVEKPRNNAYVRRVNWDENPYFPKVLDEERREMQRTDPDAYHHIWEGGFWEASNAQILNGKWIVDEFTPAPDWDGPYFGADFGFAQDPTTLVKCWIYDRRLHIERESYAVGLELDHTADRWRLDVPGCEEFIIRADSARPESISYLKRHGIPKIVGVDKWKGSVEDGIAHLRSYDKIVIHPRCKRFTEEARLYSYKVDKLTGDVLPQIVDAHNHGTDSLRYSLAPIIQNRNYKPPARSGLKLY